VEHVWSMRGACVEHAWSMRGACVEHVWRCGAHVHMCYGYIHVQMLTAQFSIPQAPHCVVDTLVVSNVDNNQAMSVHTCNTKIHPL